TLFRGCFFFSSRRRHTRSDRDWSSDVCSSDLVCPRRRGAVHAARGVPGLVDGDRKLRRALGRLRSGGVVRGAGLELLLSRLRGRSEERRVGKECRGGWAEELYKKREEMSEAGR